jgi:hypothetical protein
LADFYWITLKYVTEEEEEEENDECNVFLFEVVTAVGVPFPRNVD